MLRHGSSLKGAELRLLDSHTGLNRANPLNDILTRERNERVRQNGLSY